MRWIAAVAVVGIVALGLGVRAVGDGAWAQNAGTVLYGSMVTAGLFLLRPSLRPLPAGLVAAGSCWAIEFFQLTGVPAAFPAARLVLGTHFDWVDVGWYPVGVVIGLAVRPAAIRGRGSRADARRDDRGDQAGQP